jgi:ABC-type bacteriocin/lantibiotic exporter with double-glycine peptidase domain
MTAAGAVFPPRRVRTPTVLQMETVECGAASLAMILAYHGRYEPLEKLREECGVSRDGTKAVNLLKAARRYRLEATGYRHELAFDETSGVYRSDLFAMGLPAVLYWQMNHFLVLEGFSGNRRHDKAYLNDPAEGRRAVSLEELDSSFTGVVLGFQPEPDFERGGRPPSIRTSLESRLAGAGVRGALAYLVL